MRSSDDVNVLILICKVSPSLEPSFITTRTPRTRWQPPLRGRHLTLAWDTQTPCAGEAGQLMMMMMMIRPGTIITRPQSVSPATALSLATSGTGSQCMASVTSWGRGSGAATGEIIISRIVSHENIEAEVRDQWLLCE